MENILVTWKEEKMEGPRPRHTPPFADAERAVCLLRPPKCLLRSHEHERATIARYARARGHHPPIHRTGSGALKTMGRGHGPFCRERRAVRDLPVFFSLWAITLADLPTAVVAETGPKGRDGQGRNWKAATVRGPGMARAFTMDFPKPVFSLKWRETTLFCSISQL